MTADGVRHRRTHLLHVELLSMPFQTRPHGISHGICFLIVADGVGWLAAASGDRAAIQRFPTLATHDQSGSYFRHPLLAGALGSSRFASRFAQGLVIAAVSN